MPGIITSSRARSTGSLPAERSAAWPSVGRCAPRSPRARAGARAHRGCPRRRPPRGSTPARAARSTGVGAAPPRRARGPRPSSSCGRGRARPPAQLSGPDVVRVWAPCRAAPRGLGEGVGAGANTPERPGQRGRAAARSTRAFADAARGASRSMIRRAAAARRRECPGGPARASRALACVLEQHLAVADDVVERRAQLVAEMGERGAIGLTSGFLARSASILPRSRGSSTGLVS